MNCGLANRMNGPNRSVQPKGTVGHCGLYKQSIVFHQLGCRNFLAMKAMFQPASQIGPILLALVAIYLMACGAIYGQNTTDTADREVTFKMLTLPAETLPGGCQLASKAGLPFARPNRSNPMVTTDPTEIGMLSVFALMGDPKTERDRTSESNNSQDQQREQALDFVQELSAKHAAKIEAAYICGYHDKSRKENGVWALRFKDPKEARANFVRLTQAHRSDTSREYFLAGPNLILAWTDSKDRSCFDVIRGHLKTVTGQHNKAAKRQGEN